MNRRGFIKALAAAAVAPAVLGTTSYFDIGASRRLDERSRMRAIGMWSTGGGNFKKGDIITIGGRFAINPQTMRATEHLQQFVILDDVTDGETIELSPNPKLVRELGERGDWWKFDDVHS